VTLATALDGGNIHRVKQFLRSFLALLVTASFALGAATLGAVSRCDNQPSSAGHIQHEHGAAPGHSQSPEKGLGTIQCLVHLCCIQLVTPTAAQISPDRLSSPAASPGFRVVNSIVPVRPSHSLPLAHAPPASPS
jgi:hypothetical protein